MNKQEFFQLLDDNESEIVMAATRVRTIQRGSVVEVVLSVQGYGVFTLSRHKPDSQKLALNEEKFVRWFAEWSETEEPEAEGTDLFSSVEFISMRPIREVQAKKKPDTHPAKVTQQKKDKDYPQTSSQPLNAWRSSVAKLNYYLPNATGMHILSEIITYVFIRRRCVLNRHVLFHQKASTYPSVMAQTGRGPPRVKVVLSL